MLDVQFTDPLHDQVRRFLRTRFVRLERGQVERFADDDFQLRPELVSADDGDRQHGRLRAQGEEADTRLSRTERPVFRAGTFREDRDEFVLFQLLQNDTKGLTVPLATRDRNLTGPVEDMFQHRDTEQLFLRKEAKRTLFRNRDGE